VVNVDANSVENLSVFDNVGFVDKDVVNFVESFKIWATPSPSPVLFLFVERVCDFEVVGCREIHKIVATFISGAVSEGANAVLISIPNLRIEVALYDVKVCFLAL